MRLLQETEASGEHLPAGLRHWRYRRSDDDAWDWALLRPPPGAGDLWWVMVHGHGSTGDQLWTRQDLRERWYPLVDRYELGVLAVNLRGNAWMSAAAVADLHALLGEVRQRYGARRFVLASGSMGGTSNLIYAVRHPSDVAGVIARCPATDLARYYDWCGQQTHQAGAKVAEIRQAIREAYGGSPGQVSRAYQRHSACRHAGRLTMPLHLAHGTADALIPVSESRHLVGALARHPALHYREMADGDHDAPLALMEEAFEWLLPRI